MKLAANNIKFIDRYLENSGVKYFDIRVEMADHVASALEDMEGDFYESFQSYMVRHKTGLLASYKKYKKAVARKMLLKLFTNAVKPGGLLLLSLILSAAATMIKFKGEAATFEILEIVYVSISAVVTIHFYYLFLSEKKKFSATYTIMLGGYITIAWILSFIKPARIFERFSDFAPIVYYTILIYLLIIFYSMYISIRRELVQRYKTINV